MNRPEQDAKERADRRASLILAAAVVDGDCDELNAWLADEWYAALALLLSERAPA